MQNQDTLLSFLVLSSTGCLPTISSVVGRHCIFLLYASYNPPLNVRSVYLDIFKAFDRVMHAASYKLKQCVVSSQLLSVIQSFLQDRKNRIVLNAKCFNCKTFWQMYPIRCTSTSIFSCVHQNSYYVSEIYFKGFLLMIHPCLQLCMNSLRLQKK